MPSHSVDFLPPHAAELRSSGSRIRCLALERLTSLSPPLPPLFLYLNLKAPWCGHCQRLAPEWSKAATALKGVVKMGAVDMTQHQELGGPYNVQGFPTIKVFGQNKQSPGDYNGARTADALVDAALREVRSAVKARLGGKKSGGSKSRGG